MIVVSRAHQLIGSAEKFHREYGQSDIPGGWYLDTAREWHPGGEDQIQQVWRQGIAGVLDPSFAIPDSSLRALKTRTHIIQGDRDEIFPLAVPLDLYDKIPDSQLWILPNTIPTALFYQNEALSGVETGGNVQEAEIFSKVAESFFAGVFQ